MEISGTQSPDRLGIAQESSLIKRQPQLLELADHLGPPRRIGGMVHGASPIRGTMAADINWQPSRTGREGNFLKCK